MTELENLKAAVRELLELLQDTDVAKDERIGFSMDAVDQLVYRPADTDGVAARALRGRRGEWKPL